VEKAERKRKEEEDMRKLAEKKKAEIVKDRRRRAEQEEKEKQRKEKGKGKEVVSEVGPSSPRKRKATEEPSNAMAKRPKVSNSLGFWSYTDKLQFDPEEHCDEPTHTPACRSCTQRGWPCVNQPGEKWKATTCLACILKKIPCRIGSLEAAEPKRKAWKVVTGKAKSVTPEPVIRSSARQVWGHYNLYSSMAPGYSQQVLEELLVASANTSNLRRVAEAARKDQWKLGKRQLVLEELRLKVEIRVLSKEQATTELVRLPELAWTKVDFPVYQLAYKQWEEVQEWLVEERRQEGLGSGEEAEAEGEQ